MRPAPLPPPHVPPIGRDETILALRAKVVRGEVVALVGPPGVGKATVAVALAEAATERTGRPFAIVDVARGESPPPGVGLVLLGVDRAAEPIDWRTLTNRPLVVTSRAYSRCPPLAADAVRSVRPLSPEDTAKVFARLVGHHVFEPDALAFTGGLGGLIAEVAERSKTAPLLRIADDLACGRWTWSPLEEAIEALSPPVRNTLVRLARLAPVPRRTAELLLGAKSLERHLPVLEDRGWVWRADQQLHVAAPRVLLRSQRTPPWREDEAAQLVDEAVRRRARHYVQTSPEDLRWIRRFRSQLLEISTRERSRPELAARAAFALEPLLTTHGSMLDNVAILDHASELAHESDDRTLVSATAWAQGKAWLTRGCYERSLDALMKADGLAPSIDDVSIAAHAYVAIGHTQAALGDVATANAYLREAEGWADDADLAYERALARVQFGYVALAANDPDEALRIAEESIRETTLAQLERIRAIAELVRGRALVETGAPRPAVGAFMHAASVFVALGESAQASKIWTFAADASAKAGDVDDARALCLDAIALARRTDDEESALFAQVARADLELGAERIAEASHAVREARRLAARVGTPLSVERLANVMKRLDRITPSPAAIAVLDREGRFVRLGDVQHDLSRRAALRRILAHLVAAAEERAGESISADELFEAGWPGRAASTNARRKVYTALWALRRLGLADAIVTRDAGYALSPGRVRIGRL